MVQTLWKIWQFLSNSDLAIAFLVLTQEKWKHVHIEMCTWIFIALFKLAPIWKQPKCPSTGKQIIAHPSNRIYSPINNDSDKYTNMGESYRYYANQRITVLYEILEELIFTADNRSMIAWGGKVNFKGHEGTFLGDRNVLYVAWNDGLSKLIQLYTHNDAFYFM